MSNSMPDRWLEYKPYGDVIKGTKILTFKVPLKEGIVNNLEPEQRFSPAILMQAFPHLKYIVDLTNTGRYYDRKVFTKAGVEHQKIMVPGKKLPPMDLVKKFFKIMDDFTSSCGEGELIGVHCAHGVNRTGYFICRYLIQQLGWEAQDALKAFEEARGYPIEREAYITALKEAPRGEKIDTSNISLASTQTTVNAVPVKRVARSAKHTGGRPGSYPMGPPGFVPPRRGFANDGPFPPQHFGFGGPPPGFGPMPPPPGMPPIPPPPGPPMYGPRPHRYGPPMRPAMPPPPPGPGFPPLMPGPLVMAGPSRLPPPARLPPAKMPPPPPPPQVRPTTVMRLQAQKKKQQMRNGIVMPVRNPLRLVRRNGPKYYRSITEILPKVLKEQDFTVDTFEENLLAASTTVPQRRPAKGRFIQTK